MVAFAPWAIAWTRLVIVARASWSWAAGYRLSSSMSVKVERSSWPGGVKSYPLPCDERSKYSVPRNMTLAVAGDCGSGTAAAKPVGMCGVAAAASAAAVAAKENAKKTDRCFIISSLQLRMLRRFSHQSGVAEKSETSRSRQTDYRN